MKPHTMSAIHAFSLIVIGLWGYLGSDSQTALIPIVFGAVLLPLNSGIRHENKTFAHIAVLLTLLATIGLIKPLTGALADGDNLGLLRVGTMILTGILALVAFIQSFIKAKKNRVSS